MGQFAISAHSVFSRSRTSVRFAARYSYSQQLIVQVLEINDRYSKNLKKVMAAWEAENQEEPEEEEQEQQQRQGQEQDQEQEEEQILEEDQDQETRRKKKRRNDAAAPIEVRVEVLNSGDALNDFDNVNAIAVSPSISE